MLQWTLGIIAILATLWGVIYYFNPFDLRTWMWAAAGNSRTMAVAYSVSLLSVLDMANIIDFEPLLGATNAGRVSAIMAVLMIVMRVMTGNLSFTPTERGTSLGEDGE